MRRTFFCTLAIAAVIALVPASAGARTHHRHHRQHHHARRHHARLHRFGALARGSSAASQPADDSAGKVTSFDGTTLVIALNDGSSVAGKVTPNTELECEAPSSQSFQREDRGPSGGDDNRGEDNQGDEGGSDDQGDDRGDNQGDDDQGDGGQSCTTSDLAPGTVVIGAELKLSSAGSVWDKVELMSS